MNSRDVKPSSHGHHFFIPYKQVPQQDRQADLDIVCVMLRAHFEGLSASILNREQLALKLVLETDPAVRSKIIYRMIGYLSWGAFRYIHPFLNKREKAILLDAIWMAVYYRADFQGFDPNTNHMMKEIFELLRELFAHEKPEIRRPILLDVIRLYDRGPFCRVYILRHFLMRLLDDLSYSELMLCMPLFKRAKSDINNKVYACYLDLMFMIRERNLIPIADLSANGLFTQVVVHRDPPNTDNDALLAAGVASEAWISRAESVLRHRGLVAEVVFGQLLDQLNAKDQPNHMQWKHKIFCLLLKFFEFAAPSTQEKIKAAFIDAIGEWSRSGNIPVNLQMIYSLIPKMNGDIAFFQDAMRKFRQPLLEWGIPKLFLVELNFLKLRDVILREKYSYEREINDLPLPNSVKELVTSYQFKI